MTKRFFCTLLVFISIPSLSVDMIPEILFSENHDYVLVYDQDAKFQYNIDVWNLYNSKHQNIISSYIYQENEYYRLNRIWLETFYEVDIKEKKNISRIIEIYGLTEKGVNISDQMKYKFTSKNKRIKPPCFYGGKSARYANNEVSDLILHHIYRNDTIFSYQINRVQCNDIQNSISKILTVFTNNSPQPSLGENNVIRGYNLKYTITYKSEKSNTFFIYENFDTQYLASVTKKIISQSKKNVTWEEYAFYPQEDHKIRSIISLN